MYEKGITRSEKTNQAELPTGNRVGTVEMNEESNAQIQDNHHEIHKTTENNYFVKPNFKSSKLAYKKQTETRTEGNVPKSDQGVNRLKINNEKNEQSAENPKGCDIPLNETEATNKTKITRSPKIKSNIGNIEFLEIFHHPMTDYSKANQNQRQSESNKSEGNFRLSNILSMNDSRSDRRQSQFKKSSDLNDHTHKSKFGENQSDQSLQNVDENDSNIPIIEKGDESFENSKTFTKSDIHENNPLIDCPNNTEITRSKKLLEKGVNQNLSLQIHKKQNSMALGIQDQKRSQSKEKKEPRETHMKEERNSYSDKSCGSDDNMCKIFDVNRNYVQTGKKVSDHLLNESIEDEDQIQKAIQKEEERALSLIHEDKADLDNPKIRQDDKKVAKKSKLQLKGKTQFFPSKNIEETNQMYLRPTLIKESISFTPFDPKKQSGLDQLSNQLKEVSMFSTNDSRVVQPTNIRFDKELYLDNQCHPMDNNLNPNLSDNHKTSDSRIPFQDSDDEDNSFPDESNSKQGLQQNSRIKVGTTGDKKNIKRVQNRKCQPVNDQKEFQINIDSIPSDRTTVMIKNIPNRYSKEMMMDMIDKDFKSTYNFFYLPIDFERDANVGYAFVNFLKSKTIRDFYLKFSGMKWSNYNSDKVCDVSYARIQGKEACMKHFENSSLMKQNVT